MERKYPHENCDNEIRALQKRIIDLEEWQRTEIEKKREILATLDLVKRLVSNAGR